MQLCVEHQFRNTDLKGYLDIYFDDDFNRSICTQIGVIEQERLAWHEQPDGTIVLRSRVVPACQLPPMVTRLLGRQRIEYSESSVFNPQKNTLCFSIEHPYTRYLQVSGTITFSDSPTGVCQQLHGDVVVGMRAVRSIAERMIESELRKAFDKRAILIQQHIDATVGKA
jgi:hypothetical protein